mmetsp:Transcript_28592/g.60990  ORF Transcript_28592/g.60990 Transcript_28592/m.60990 type:complete len:113 (+) Transcript_28592:1395-1733(+)
MYNHSQPNSVGRLLGLPTTPGELMGPSVLIETALPPAYPLASRMRIDEMPESSSVCAAFKPAHPAPMITASYSVKTMVLYSPIMYPPIILQTRKELCIIMSPSRNNNNDRTR